MSETAKRILSAVIGLPVYLFTFATDGYYAIPILVASLIISLGCLYEYYLICGKTEGLRPFTAVGMAMGVLVNIVVYIYAFGKVYGYTDIIAGFDARFLLAVLFAGVAVISALQVFTRPITGGIYSLAVTMFGVVFIAFSVSHIILLKSLKDGFYYILILNAVVMINDAAAYFGGINFGKHKANIKVSPNKSWEGYFTGLLMSIISMMVISLVLESFFGKRLFGMLEAALLGIALSVFGNIGDLVESAIKRDGAIKDSGSLIPGHGG
ncbi:MAG TPA: hypothetical protein ENN21_07510, partial [Spirochaetes bacterium]|nr:hypothetical protein [Spirochaetota bacterium]